MRQLVKHQSEDSFSKEVHVSSDQGIQIFTHTHLHKLMVYKTAIMQLEFIVELTPWIHELEQAIN